MPFLVCFITNSPCESFRGDCSHKTAITQVNFPEPRACPSLVLVAFLSRQTVELSCSELRLSILWKILLFPTRVDLNRNKHGHVKFPLDRKF